MFPDFDPLFRNPHIATIAGNFWPREVGLSKFPAIKCHYAAAPGVTVVAIEQQPLSPARAQVVCLHGLEGSAKAGYLQSCAASLLRAGCGVHRLNLRSCGGTESLCDTMYHSGLTGDTWHVVQEIKARYGQPTYLVGCSLGGNVALKLAGEHDCEGLLDGVCSISTPIDLAACVRTIDKRSNILYSRRFLSRLKARIRRKSAISPCNYSADGLDQVRSIWEFDDRFTAPLFGFGSAENYYNTQSAQNFIPGIQIPTLMIAAQDDPLVPFGLYQQAAVQNNPNISLLAPRFGGHLGFLSRRKPRFWLDEVVLQWINQLLRNQGTPNSHLTSLER